VRFVIGNPLIMKEMVKHDLDAGSYAPVTILVDERADCVHLPYDRMASFLASYRSAEALGAISIRRSRAFFKTLPHDDATGQRRDRKTPS
jgi:hypothetical protein